MPIKDFSGRGRIPRLGKVRLGIKKKGSGAPYPAAVDYFVCPPEVQAVYGPKPKKLNIAFHSDEVEEVFPQYYKRYGKSTGLACKGDGEAALAVNPETGEFAEIECTGRDCGYYQKNACKQIGNLYFMVRGVNRFGVYQLDTSSYNSILNVNGGIEYAKKLTRGRLALMPFILEVVSQEVAPQGAKKTVYVLRLEADMPKMMAALDESPANVLKLEDSRIHERGDIEEDHYPEPVVKTLKATEDGLIKMWGLVKEAGIGQEEFKNYLVDTYKINSSKELTSEELKEVLSYLKKTIEAKKEPQPVQAEGFSQGEAQELERQIAEGF